MMRVHIVSMLAICIICSGPLSFAGGERANVRGMGMARTYTATSRGLDAVGINPANLGLDDENTLTLRILPFGIHFGSEFLDYDLYTTYFTGVQTDSGRVARYLDENDKQRILNAFGSDIADNRANVDAQIIGVSWRLDGVGTLAFTVTDELGASANVPRDYVDFFLNGNTPGSSYDFKGAAVTASWIREYSLSFGTELPKVSFLQRLAGGVGLKLVHGYAYYEIQRLDATLNTGSDGALSGRVDFLARSAGDDPFKNRLLRDYALFPDHAGTGVAFDVGMTGVVTKYLSCGISLTDVGFMKWTGNTKETYADTTLLVDDPLRSDQRDAIESAIRGRKKSGSPFKTSLPTTLRLGVALKVDKLPAVSGFPGELLIALDYNQGLRNTPSLSTDPRVSLGIEYTPLQWLPLRTGASFGGTDRVNIAFGFGLNFGVFSFDLSSENVSWLFVPKSFSYGSVAMGMQLKF